MPCRKPRVSRPRQFVTVDMTRTLRSRPESAVAPPVPYSEALSDVRCRVLAWMMIPARRREVAEVDFRGTFAST